MTSASDREQEAKQAKQDYERQLGEFDHQRDTLLEDAKKSAGLSRSQMVEQAQHEVADARDQWMQEVNEEKAAFIDALRQQSLTAVESIARKALKDLADEELEQRIAKTFIRRLTTLEQGAQNALNQAKVPATVSSSFELTADTKSAITQAIQTQTGTTVTPVYRQSPELICGIELFCEGRVISWNLSDYLDEMSKSINQAFDPVTARQPGH
eukprot:TRINITY_DN124_c0_g3_i1.p2 TRINITY_DN124_c0_g3~~TRINITY_DN124_c0_g3_i1.p2  ORF type:complete len:219 (+),score=51.17 TRINITY_DN124_c0_g3_i1:24-659(+)